MSSEKNNGGVFHGNSIMNCSSSNGMDPFYAASNWDPIVSLNQSGSFENCSNMVSQNEFANHTIGSSSNLDHFSEMVSSFGHIPQSNFAHNSENGVYGKRKRKILVGASSKNAEEEEDPSGDTAEEDKMKQKLEENKGRNSRDKQAVKEVKDSSSGAEPSKENYVHVRAKRGQATNSHSLAERVRRERISERMRLLQELVPGCNKITGKAVMLDEIINYVQSLQQQVEFLSMKLATVNPELNVDIDRILSKDILNMRGSNGAALGIGPGINLSHPFPGYPQGTFNLTPGANAPFHSLPQHIWNNELQGILQMGFDSDPSVSSLGPNGLSKMEL